MSTAVIALTLAGSATAQIFWTNRAGTTISRSTLDGTVVDPSFIGGLSAPRGVAIDGQFIYWAAGNASGTIGRANLDGTPAPGSNFPIATGESPQAIALDGSSIYWSNTVSGVGKIGTARRSGTGATSSLMTPASAPCGVASDADQVYWANTGSPGSIGTQHGVLSAPDQSFIAATDNPCGVALAGGYIYWTNQAGNSIGRADHQGGNPEQNFIPLTTTTSPCGVAVDGQHIYWTTASGTIGRANLDGGGKKEAFITGAQDPCGIAVSPRAGISPDSYRFPSTTVGGRSDIQAFFIADAGSSVLNVSSVAFSGANPSDFQITGDGCTATTTSPSLGCVLNLRFTPTAAGNRSATLEVKSNASNSPTEVPISGAAAPPDTRPPKIHGASVNPAVFAVRRGGRPKAPARSVKRGTTFDYSLSERAQVAFSVERKSAGRLVGGICLPERRANRHRPRCIRTHMVGTFFDAGAAGANERSYGGRVDDKPLRPARYRVNLTATDPAGNVSTRVRLGFRIVRARSRGD